MRAIAVLSVVAFHIGLAGVPGGFVGVDIFFVISGYLITDLIRRELERNGDFSFVAFYGRRLRRLAPAMIVVALCTAALAYFLLLPDDQNKLGRQIRAVALISANHHFLKHAFDYFDLGADTKPLLHTWSLAVEEQFYLVWPLLLFGVYRVGRAVAFRRRVLLAMLAALFAASFAYCVWLSVKNGPAAFYLMATRAWEFAIGGALCLIPAKAGGHRIATFAGAAGLALLAASITLINEGMLFPGYVALLPVLGTALVLQAGALDRANPVSRLLAMNPWRSIGLVSYGWYLWHWPLLALARYWSFGERVLWRDFLLAGPLALALAWLTYRFIEQPIRLGAAPWLRDRREVIKRVLLVSFGIWLLGTLSMELPARWPWPGQHAVIAARHDAMAMPKACDMPAKGIPLAPPSACTFGQHGTAPQVLVWGDSHADHLMPMLDEQATKRGLTLLRRVYHGCPPTPGAVPAGEGAVRTWCLNFAQAVQAEIDSLTQTGLRGVIIGARWRGYTAGQHVAQREKLGLLEATSPAVSGSLGAGAWRAGEGALTHAASLQVMERSLESELARLTRLGLRVLIVLPAPEFHYPPPECLQRMPAAQCDVSRAAAEAARSEIRAALTRAAANKADVRLWDPLVPLCGDSVCAAANSAGLARYQDRDHLTASTARTLGASFEASLQWLAGEDATP